MSELASESGSQREPVRVFLVDDHALFRSGVRAELDRSVPDVAVVGEAGSVAEAVAGIAHLRPDVVLLDVHMPDGGGAEVLRRVRPAQPDVVFLALSVSDAAEDVIAVIRSGARGYVTKTISGRELADAVHRVRAGDPVFSPRLAGFVLDAFSDRPGAAPPTDPELDRLTRRERDVLRLLARGLLLPGDRGRARSSRSRPSRRTCRACCARPSCRTGTSFRAGPRTAGSSSGQQPARAARHVLDHGGRGGLRFRSVRDGPLRCSRGGLGGPGDIAGPVRLRGFGSDDPQRRRRRVGLRDDPRRCGARLLLCADGLESSGGRRGDDRESDGGQVGRAEGGWSCLLHPPGDVLHCGRHRVGGVRRRRGRPHPSSSCTRAVAVPTVVRRVLPRPGRSLHWLRPAAP